MEIPPIPHDHLFFISIKDEHTLENKKFDEIKDKYDIYLACRENLNDFILVPIKIDLLKSSYFRKSSKIFKKKDLGQYLDLTEATELDCIIIVINDFKDNLTEFIYIYNNIKLFDLVTFVDKFDLSSIDSNDSVLEEKIMQLIDKIDIDRYWEEFHNDNMTYKFKKRMFNIVDIKENNLNADILNNIRHIRHETIEFKETLRTFKNQEGTDYNWETTKDSWLNAENTNTNPNTSNIPPKDLFFELYTPPPYLEEPHKKKYECIEKIIQQLFEKLYRNGLLNTIIYLFSKFATSRCYAHICMNNIEIIKTINSCIRDNNYYHTIVVYSISYWIYMMYKEESVFKTNSNINHRHIMDINRASIFPADVHYQRSDPYIPLTLSRDSIKMQGYHRNWRSILGNVHIDNRTKDQQAYGFHSLVKFKERFTIFSNGLLEGLDWKYKNSIISITGGCMEACAIKNPIELLYNSTSSYFAATRNSSDVDVMVYVENDEDYLEVVNYISEVVNINIQKKDEYKNGNGNNILMINETKINFKPKLDNLIKLKASEQAKIHSLYSASAYNTYSKLNIFGNISESATTSADEWESMSEEEQLPYKKIYECEKRNM